MSSNQKIRQLQETLTIPETVDCGFDHTIAIGQENQLYMWGSLTNYKLDALKNWEENIINEVPIIHKNKEYVPLSISCGNQYSLIVCKKKKGIFDEESKNDIHEDDGIGHRKLPSSNLKPSMDSRKQDFEHFYNYLKRILSVPSDEPHKEMEFTNLMDFLSEVDPDYGQDYKRDENNSSTFESPIYYENFEISKKSFVQRMNELLDHPNPKIQEINKL